MKIKKVVRYNYELEENNLEEDIEKFIKKAKKGNFHMDKMYGNEALRILKQYLKILNEKFKNDEFEECKRCYHKLIPFLLVASNGETDLFDYNDLLAKISNNFDDYIRKYFICLIKTCNIDELADKISEYASSLDIYGFESDTKVLIENLDKEMLDKLTEKMLSKTIAMTHENTEKHEIIYFLMNIANERKDKEEYQKLCEKFRGVLKDSETDSLKGEYGDCENGE